jgi:hypothetical protein
VKRHYEDISYIEDHKRLASKGLHIGSIEMRYRTKKKDARKRRWLAIFGRIPFPTLILPQNPKLTTELF